MGNNRPTDRLPMKAKALFNTLPLSERRQVVVALAKNHDNFISENVKIHGSTIYINEEVFRLRTAV
jgi:hypothetical protein